MGHYLSEMEGGELDEAGKASLERFRLKCDRDKALREARVVGMTAAIEHLVRHSPLPVDLAYVGRHLGRDGRDPEAGSVSEAVMRLMSRQENRMQLTGDQRLVLPAEAAR